MTVKPYRNRKGEIVPDAWEICWYETAGEGLPKRERKKVVKNTTEANARLIGIALLRTPTETQEQHNPTVNDKWHEWLRSYSRDNSAGTITDIEYASLRLLPHFGTWRLSDLTQPLCENYMDKRLTDTWRPPIKNPDPKKTYAPAKPISKRRINTELKYFKLFLDYCIERKYMYPLPFVIPKFRKLPKRSASIPSVSEVDALLTHCHSDALLAVLLFHDAGLRKSEAFGLTVDDLLLDDDLIHVIGKGDKERYVAIPTTRLKAALDERARQRQYGLLLPNPRTGEPYKDLRKAIEGAADRAGIHKRIYQHLFRHTYISRSHEAGVPLPEIQEQAGHADISTTRGYTHLSTRHRVQQAKLLDKHLLSEAASQKTRQRGKKEKQ